MKTKFVKVSVDQRNPEKTDYYFSSEGQLKFNISKNNWFDLWGERVEGDELPKWWLLEVPDREDEMREMLKEYVDAIENETIIVKENEDNDGWENFGGRFYDKAKKLLNELK